jgi:subtilase family serine protease
LEIPRRSPFRRLTGFAAPVAAAATVLLASGVLASGVLASAPAAAQTGTASTAGRAALPNPTPLDAYTGKPGWLKSAPLLRLRVYLSGRPGRTTAALAVSTPGNPQYGHYLTAAQFRQRYGAAGTQIRTVSHWLAGQGMKITASNSHYIAVDATVAEADAAFGTRFIQYNFPPVVVGGKSFPGGAEIGTMGGFSVPAALGGDVAAVTGLQFTNLPVRRGPAAPSMRTVTAAPASPASPAGGYRCSHYWGQHTEAVPVAYGATRAATQLCGYTPNQLRTAYGVSSSRYTGKGATIAIVMTGSSPTMLADANRFFSSHGLAGFTPGQFTVNAPATVASSCSGGGPGGLDVNRLEEAIDVESAHITAPAAHVIYTAADCSSNWFGGMQDLLDAATRVVDQHLANVVSGSFSDDENAYSPADAAAWDLTFEQGAIEGIGFDLASGDGGADINPPDQNLPFVSFPSSSSWITAVGGTTLEIGRNGGMVADYPWGDKGTKVNAAGTGYSPSPPGSFLEGSTGGPGTLYAEPGYQKPVVPLALATEHGASSPRRVVPDISANAEGSELIGYTGAVKTGVYGQITQGGTSAATPLFAGLEADAIQATGHPLGFLNPALYLLHGSAAIRDVLPVSPAHPPVVIGAQPYFGKGDGYLTTLGEDQFPLRATKGYDDETGLGTPGPSFVTAFGPR